MAQVFVVTTGSYSDYSISAIFSTREKAEVHKAKYVDANEIEVFELDEFRYPANMFFYQVRFARDGKTDVEKVDPDYGYEDVRPYGDGKMMVTYCWAESVEHAAKIGNERRVKTIAAAQWFTDFDTWRNTVFLPSKAKSSTS